jgi:tRNA pseudouridine38/39 synthase
MAENTPDYNTWTPSALIARVTDLERQLTAHTTSSKPPSSPPRLPTTPPKPAKPSRPFDRTKYTTRHIALKFAYLGQGYNGYEHHNGNVTPLPTVEEVLWKALRKGFLIFPENEGELKEGEISWEGCQYSKCGRTDRGVSAFGQVIGVRVRSRRKGNAPLVVGVEGKEEKSEGRMAGANEVEREVEDETFDSIGDEMPYVQILNNLLPPDIRILAWCPSPPPNFDARFSCKERRYRYFFTQPAFAPTPGPVGFERVPGSKSREGWLDIEAMRDGARRLVGLHDFRNFCKVDPSKQITNFERRVFHADIEAVDLRTGPVGYVGKDGFRQFVHEEGENGRCEYESSMGDQVASPTPQIYSFTVHGSAFLWHQVRCMVAIMFLIGQGLEPPSLVSELLDVKRNPRKPTYEMATDAPLVLWDCIFPAEGGDPRTDSLGWVYAGDSRGLQALPGKSDGKFGLGGVVDELWATWRQRKIDEILAGTLLDFVVGQGDAGAAENGGFKGPKGSMPKSQKLFEGRDTVRLGGKYVSVMQKPLMETVEVQNAKFVARKGIPVDAVENGGE